MFFFSLQFGALYCHILRLRTDLSYLHRTALSVAISLFMCFSSFIHGMLTWTKSIKSVRAKTEVKILGFFKKVRKQNSKGRRVHFVHLYGFLLSSFHMTKVTRWCIKLSGKFLQTKHNFSETYVTEI